MEGLEILVCQNEHVVALEIERRVEQIGHTVTAIATNGEDVLDFAERAQPDLSILGIMLNGELNGFETASILASQFNIPSVYLINCYDLKVLQGAGLGVGVGYILRPFRNYQLDMCIQNGVRSHHQHLEVVSNLNRPRIELDGSTASIARLQRAAEYTKKNNASSLSGSSVRNFANVL